MIDIDCVFLDTNILIYAHVRDDEKKFRIIESLLGEKLKDSRIFVSVQIVNEFYTEDMQHGQVIEDTLKIINPFE